MRGLWLIGLAVVIAMSCGGGIATTGSETHFLEPCGSNDCGDLSCVCGVCTKPCSQVSDCSPLHGGARCIESADLPNADTCSQLSPVEQLCDVPCTTDTECASLGSSFRCETRVCRSVAGTDGGSGTGGSGGGLPIARNPEFCALPQDVGACNAAFPRYWYNANTGVCEQFIYGGCQGNENNFETLSECYAACPNGQDSAFCDSSDQCTVTFTGCCAPCEPLYETQLVGVRSELLESYQQLKGCGPIACPPCVTSEPESENRRYFGATCNAGQCELFDVRQAEFVTCAADADCMLRAGLDCCERCDATPETLVAVNQNSAGLRRQLCGTTDCASATGCSACPPCAPVYPLGYSAACNQGVCEVRYEFN
jgi:hypothetical protein